MFTTTQDIHEFSGRLARRLQSIYGATFSESHVNGIIRSLMPSNDKGILWDETDVILITYGNSIIRKDEKPLITLRRFMDMQLKSFIRCVHILPFFPSTSDDGFAISDYTAVDEALGTWNDIADIVRDFNLMADLVLNHVSASHPWFREFLEEGPGAGNYFILKDEQADYRLVVRPRSTPLFTRFNARSGPVDVWTTFGADQVDLNFANPEVLIEMIRVMLLYIEKGARIIRLDAVAFIWKEPGTSCLHHHHTHEIVKLLRDIIDFVNPGVILLTETNVPNPDNWSYFGQDDEARMVYQFTLPPLILYTLFSGNSDHLTRWAETIPDLGKEKTFLNFTASHDGIGVRPLEGILPAPEIERLIKGIRNFGGLISTKSNPDGSGSAYELNITYFSALAGTEQGTDNLAEARFMASQAIMLALRGIPAIYIHSLFAAENDANAVRQTGMARSINRKRWEEEDLLHAMNNEGSCQRIFSAYTRMIGIRKQFSAFHPNAYQQIMQTGNKSFAFWRENPGTFQKVLCITNISAADLNLELSGPAMKAKYTDLLEEIEIQPGRIQLAPYQTRWLI